MNRTEARDAISDVILTAWAASVITQAIDLQWSDVVSTRVADGTPWARVTVRHTFGQQETLGGPGVGKHQTEGSVTIDVFTPFGDGHTLSDQIVQVLLDAMRNKRVGNLWFFGAVGNEVGQDGAWFAAKVRVGFRYVEQG